MEISKEKLDEINRAMQQHFKRKQEDPEYRKKCEEDKKRIDNYYAFGTNTKK